MAHVPRVYLHGRVGPGPLTLLYPKFLPGNHAATGPIRQTARAKSTFD